MKKKELDKFTVGDKVIHIDKENLLVFVGVISEVHGDNEYDIRTHFNQTISPIDHVDDGRCIYKLEDDVYDYMCELEKHAESTGFFKDNEEE